MYRALYRKWRPLVFSDVAGQDATTQTLRAQVASNRLSHAYLFTGTRGTGKTTCAKILARAANCERPVAGDPCNECPACKGLLDGSLLDVIEIDAASYNGVDSIRELREESVYAPVSLARRVYIIDEVHMLSASAFNALLKTLEEPPGHVLFVLATTEVTKVPATILSRCQRYVFKRISVEDITARLLYVAGQEGISLTEEAAKVLARMSDGAMRDALSLLDQCAAVYGQTLDDKGVMDLLGLVERGRMEAWAQTVVRRDIKEALAFFRALYAEGREPAALLDALYRFLHDSLASVILREDGTAEALVEDFGKERLLDCLTLLQDTGAQINRSATPKIDAELCLLRLCRTGMVHVVEEVPPPMPEKRKSAPAEKTEEKQDTPTIKPDHKSESGWQALREAVLPNLPPSIAPFWRKANGKTEDGTLTVVVDSALAADRLDQPEVRAVIEEQAASLYPSPLALKITLRDKTNAALNPRLEELMQRVGQLGTREGK